MTDTNPVLPFGLRVVSQPLEDSYAVRDAREKALCALYTGDPLDVARAAFHGATWESIQQPPAIGVRWGWSVVIPVRGAHDQLRRCLERLAKAGSGGAVEIIVVLPRDEVTDVWRIAGAAVQPVVSDQPLGFAAACNAGFRASRGDRVLFLNSDAYVPRRWTEHFDIALDHVHAVGPWGTNVSGFQSYGTMAARPRTFLDGSTLQKPPSPRLVGFCLAVRRQSFLRVGGWNEEYGVGNFDDDDLSLRLALLSKPGEPSLGWASACLVEHEGSASFKALPDAEATYARLMKENGEKFERRWGWATEAIGRWWGAL